MAIRTFRVQNAKISGTEHLYVQETDIALITGASGWTVAKLANPRYAQLDSLIERASGSFSTTSAIDATTGPNDVLGDCIALSEPGEVPFYGQFPAGNWTITAVVRAVDSGGSQDGRIRARVWAATNRAGTNNVRQITSATQVGSIVTNLATTADLTSTITWAAPAITLTDEFLFIQIEWEITGAGGANAADVVLRHGSSSTGTRIVTTNFVASPRTYYGSMSMGITFGQTISGRRKTFSSLTGPFTFQAVVAGNRLAPTLYGAMSLPVIFGKEVNGQRKTFGQLTAPFLFSKDVRGQRKTFGQIAFPINAAIATVGSRVGLTLYGAVALPITFSKDIRGQRKAFGQIGLPLTFVKDVKGVRKTFGQIAFPIIFTKEAVGRKQVFGQLSMYTVFGKETAGRRKTFGQLALPISFSKVVSGQRKAFGLVAFPIGFQAFVDGRVFVGQKTYYGQLVFPVAFGKQVVAYRKTFGKTNSPFIFGSTSQGRRRTFSKIVVPLNFEVVVKSGRIGAHGRIVLPIVIGITTAGRIITAGIILNDALDLYLGEQNIVAAYVGSERVWP